RGPLFIATPYATRLDEIATATFRGAPDDLARLGFAVAHALDPQAPSVPDFPVLAEMIASALKTAKKPLVISGMSCASEAVMEAAANVAMAAHAALSLTAPECNTVGAALTGGTPLTAAFEAVRDGRADTVIILENDLYRRAPAADVDAFLAAAKHVIVLDHLANPTTAKAELELPAGTFAESDGTFISSEGRAQRFFQVLAPQENVLASWRWLKPEGWQSLDDALAALSKALPELAPASYAAPSAKFRIAGAKIPRSPHRESGRTAALVNINISEPKTPEDPDSALSYSMEGTSDQPPAALIPFFWSPGWNSIQSTNTYQTEPGGPLRGGDAGVRMFEPPAPNGQTWFTSIPAAFQPRAGEWLLVPMYHFIGSEELSQAARGLAELATRPHVAVNSADLTEGAEVEVSCASGTLRVPVHLRPELPRGIACLSAGIAPISGVTLSVWGRIEVVK
ncbi:MAG TPA: molybdopterin-dependent oxidoreductase, partial [Candidatus Solibacter sp.]|nr:molybdopterin-dependent oxidoreductase [Candidatus Solibacter sp.]